MFLFASIFTASMADKRRRKSLSIFRQKVESRPSVQIPSSPVFEKHSSEYLPSPVESEPASPRVRPRTLQKSIRASAFGSLRSLHSLDEDEKIGLARSDSKASSLQEEVDMNRGLFGSTVLQYGEVQVGSSNVFRKRTQFIVLTESHVIRFRSLVKAAEMFPSIPSSLNKGHVPRSSSVNSVQELSAYTDITSGIPLEQVVAVYKIDDGRLSPTVEVAHLDERAKKATTMHLQLNDLREAELWIAAIRSACNQARALPQYHFQDRTLEHLARVLERERDYDPEHFHFFKVVQKSVNKSMGRASAEDLTRVGSSTTCYLVIGLHKIHLVPLQKSSTRSSSTSLSELDAMTSYAIVALTSVKVLADEDAFQFTFKAPTSQPCLIQLASYAAGDIVVHLRSAAEFLRPEWFRQPFFFDVPPEVDEQVIPPSHPKEEHDCFDRTLIAYCAGYDLDTSRICYSVDYECEDAPCFQLLSPSKGPSYSILELIAVLRALRYNESFTSISFAQINLDPLRKLYDVFGSDVDSQFTRSGNPVNLAGHEDMPVLCQEIRALALKSRRLRRLDFSYTSPTALAEGQEPTDCGMLEALVPLCKRSLTNVDWIVLTGLRLSDHDLNYLVDAASEKKCHLRALQIGECGLSVHDIDVLLSTLSCQENTIEVIDISGAQGRFSPELFQRGIGAFTRIRRLNLTRVQKTAGPEPLLAPEVLFAWRLEALHMSQTTLNEQSVDSVAAYLAASKSEILRELHINQCGLTGHDLATFFRAMTRDDKQPRTMHVSANENRLRSGNTLMFRTLGQNCGPTSLSLRMMDFDKESHFRELIDALKVNTTLRSLDISRASLPYDASIETCEALKEMFATNQTLEELDISGEHAHLDATRYGIGLNIALRGLERNRSLKLLRIEHQALGLQGASTLAEVLQKNDTLLEIHCEHNDINLQSFTALVNALERNHTLLFLSSMDHDRARTMEKVLREVETMEQMNESKSAKHGGALKKAFKGTFHSKTHGKGHANRHSSSMSPTASITDQDLAAVMSTLEERWNTQVARLQKYLFRNYCRAQGAPWEDTIDESSRRPTTSGDSSLAQILQRV